MATLLLAEHDNTTLGPATARALTAALALGAPVTLLVMGAGCTAVAAEGARLDGVQDVLLADAPQLAHHLAEPLAELVRQLASGYDAIFAPASSTGKNVMPRVAALLDVMQVSEAVEIIAPDTFVRPIYAGNALETLRSGDATKVVTVRTSAFNPAGQRAEPAPVTTIAVPADAGRSAFVGEELSRSELPDLGSARIVVSGGRALQSRENFDTYLLPLATRLGAAIGASRAAVDAGYASNDLQVGQTGKMVAPDLYIACGISGAVQHLAGMKESRYIVAINTDPDAPIFKVADFGLVGDLFTVLPELTGKL